MISARPLLRCAARPGRRAIDSPMPLSGSLPMSSAETDSTTVSEFFFFAVALRSAARKPVTTIAPWLAAGCSVFWALAAVSLGGGGVAGWSAAGWVAVPVIAAFAADAVSAA